MDEREAKARLRVAFGREVTVLLGEEDTVITNPALKTPEAMAQGAHRVERGDTFFETARRQAEKLGIPFRWKIRTVRGAGHSNRDMASAGAKVPIGNGP